MSASPMARQVTENKAIPTRRVQINDPSDLPSSYSSTPGGTLFSTTPGGTRLVYEKTFLMNLRNSPISKTPPTFDIPDSMMKGSPNRNQHLSNNHNNSYNNRSINNNLKKSPNKHNKYNTKKNHDEDQFQIEL